MRCLPHELSRKSGSRTLSGWDGSSDHPFTELVTGQSQQGMWRVIELSSRSLAPFVARLKWGLGGAAGGDALVTVCRDTRVAVYATYVQVLTYNLDSADNIVSARIGDSESFVATENVHVHTDSFVVDDESREVEPPRFARRVRFDCGVLSALSSFTLTFKNGQGDTIKEMNASVQPDEGVRLGGIDSILVSLDPALAVDWRLVFDLSL